MRVTKTACLLGATIFTLSNFSFAENTNPYGLKTTDASGCYLTEGTFTAPTIALMTGAYNDPAVKKDVVLQIIKVAIAAKCKIDEPDEAGMSPLNAAILYNEPELVALYLSNGADPKRKISSKRPWMNNLNSFEFLEAISKRTSANRNDVKVELSKNKRKV